MIDNKAKVNAIVHTMTDFEAEAFGEVVTGTLQINFVLAHVFFTVELAILLLQRNLLNFYACTLNEWITIIEWLLREIEY